MMKNYTLSYFFNTYQNDQPDYNMVDFAAVEVDTMFYDLRKITFSPSEESVQKILEFSRSYEVLHSKLSGSIEVIKN